MDIANQYSLAYNENYVAISYVGLAYTNAGYLQYRYKMDGIDSNWLSTTNTNVRYTSLPPGKFTFQVYAINEDGFGNETPELIHFTIRPPFWETWWFKTLTVFAALLAVYGFFKVKILTYNRDVVRELLMLLLRKLRRKVYLVVKMDSGLVKIDPNKIMWIQAANIYVEIVTKEKKYLVRSSLKAIEEQLPGREQFVRVHRSYIVRIDKIKGIQSKSIMINGTAIPVGYKYKMVIERLRDQFQLLNH
jgi:hypothetical protein